MSLHPDEAIIENNDDGCSSEQEVTEACHIVGINSSGSNKSLCIYPNPSNSTIYISSNKSIEIEKVQVFNQNGKIVLNKKNWKTGIDISGLKKGVYIVEAVSDKQKFRNKIIIE